MNRKSGSSKLKIIITVVVLIIIAGTSGYIYEYRLNNDANHTASTSTLKATQSTTPTKSPEVTPSPSPSPSLSPSPSPSPSAEPTATADNSKMTPEKAAQLIYKIAAGNGKNIKTAYDHTQKRDGVDYYVIHLFEAMPDHIATLGWFYVQADTGKAFSWDITNDTLTPVN